MRSFLRGIAALLDVILPRSARTVRLESLSERDMHVIPKAHEACGIHITTLLDYRDPATEDLVRALKYDDSPQAARLLAAVLADYLEEEIAHVRRFYARALYIVPLPLHSARERERGFNQVMRVLECLPAHQRALIRGDILIRARQTKQQTKLSRTERLQNVRGAFSVSEVSGLERAYAFIVDDVSTTGATLSEASKTLARAGAEVHALALARA